MWKWKKQEPIEKEDDEPIVINIDIKMTAETAEAIKKSSTEKTEHNIEIKDIKTEGKKEDIGLFRNLMRSIFRRNDDSIPPVEWM